MSDDERATWPKFDSEIRKGFDDIDAGRVMDAGGLWSSRNEVCGDESAPRVRIRFTASAEADGDRIRRPRPDRNEAAPVVHGARYGRDWVRAGAL